MSKLSDFLRGAGGSDPVGALKEFAAPMPVESGWLRRDGASYLIDDYPELFSLIGHRYTHSASADHLLPDPSVMPDRAIRSIKFSSDGNYLAVLMSQSTSPEIEKKVSVYKVEDGSITLIDTALIEVTTGARYIQLEFTLDSSHLLVCLAHSTVSASSESAANSAVLSSLEAYPITSSGLGSPLRLPYAFVPRIASGSDSERRTVRDIITIKGSDAFLSPYSVNILLLLFGGTWSKCRLLMAR